MAMGGAWWGVAWVTMVVTNSGRKPGSRNSARATIPPWNKQNLSSTLCQKTSTKCNHIIKKSSGRLTIQCYFVPNFFNLLCFPIDIYYILSLLLFSFFYFSIHLIAHIFYSSGKGFLIDVYYIPSFLLSSFLYFSITSTDFSVMRHNYPLQTGDMKSLPWNVQQ